MRKDEYNGPSAGYGIHELISGSMNGIEAFFKIMIPLFILTVSSVGGCTYMLFSDTTTVKQDVDAIVGGGK